MKQCIEVSFAVTVSPDNGTYESVREDITAALASLVDDLRFYYDDDDQGAIVIDGPDYRETGA